MKRPIPAILAALVLVLSLTAQAPPQAPPSKPDVRAKNLDLVDKILPPDEAFKAGFESISAKDSLAMLTYIASDLMEGREAGTRGYQAAAEYDASLFGLAKLKPLGDAPLRSFTMSQMLLGPSQAPAKPVENTYPQEFPLIETVERPACRSRSVHSRGAADLGPWRTSSAGPGRRG